jgi:hypothetical protein
MLRNVEIMGTRQRHEVDYVADSFFTKITLSRESYVNCYTEFHENPSDCLVVDIRFKDSEHGLNAGFFFARCGGLVIERDRSITIGEETQICGKSEHRNRLAAKVL